MKDQFKGYFSSGPTRKFKGWNVDLLKNAAVGRSHRSDLAKKKLKELIDRTKKLLHIPEDFRVAILPGSATGAVETALWNLLGNNPVTCHEVDVFSALWSHDIQHELKLPCHVLKASSWGELPDKTYHADHDYVITLNASTSGTYYDSLDWVPKNRKNLLIADATSSVFAIPVDFDKIDAYCFSWQKGLGGEAAHGMIALSPRAYQRLVEFTPDRPIPRLFTLKRGTEVNDPLFDGITTNTPSMLCVEDCLVTLDWAEKMGGVEALYKKAQENLDTLKSCVREHHEIFRFSSSNPSPTTPCIIVKAFESMEKEDHFERLRAIAKEIDEEGLATDIVNHAYAFPAFRLWCGPTVEKEDIKTVTQALVKKIKGSFS